jgi:hypothetical protein
MSRLKMWSPDSLLPKIGDVPVITLEHAFLVFDRWVEGCSPIRLDAQLPSCRISCIGIIESAVFPMLRFRFTSSGFINIYLPESTRFGWAAPDPLRIAPLDDSGNAVRYGQALAAINQAGENFLFVEVEEA